MPYETEAQLKWGLIYFIGISFHNSMIFHSKAYHSLYIKT